MATPVGHYLVGLSVARLLAKDRDGKRQGQWLALLACAPDLDVIPGLFFGNLSQFHHGISHSFAVAAIFSTAAYLFLKWLGYRPSFRLCIVILLLYSSHSLLDVFTLDTGAPYGVPLFWPWSHEAYQSTWVLLPNVQHTRAPLMSAHNLLLMVRETLLFLPLVGLVEALKNFEWPQRWTEAGLYGVWFALAVWASVFSLQGR
jgi:inner membrane protein